MNVIEIAIILAGLGLYFAFRIRSAQGTFGTAASQAARLARIRYVARFFKWLCCAAFGVVIFIAAVAIFVPEQVGKASEMKEGSISFAMSGPILMSDFKPEYKALYPVFWLFLCAFLSRGIGFLHRIFTNMEKGFVFCRDNVRCIRSIGWLLVAAPLLRVGFELSKVIWSVDGTGILIWNLPNDLLKGFFVIFIAWIMDEGRKIQEEQELTV